MLAAIVLLAATAAVTPVPVTGVAYDQVTMVTRGGRLFQVTQFDAAWAAEVDAIKANPGPVRADTGLPVGQISSYAWLGDSERIENPTTGYVLIIRHGDHETIAIDSAKRTYTVSTGVGDVYSISTGPVPASPAASAPQVSAVFHKTFDTLPDSVIDGVAYKGYAGRVTQTVDDSRCKYAQQLAFVMAFVDPNRSEPRMNADDPYAFWLTNAATSLSQVSSCNVTLPDGVQSGLPYYPNFLLYAVSQPMIAGRDISLQPLPRDVVTNVMMRGHVRALTSADAALFEPPAGFTKVP
jgi:hypothetical protein